MLTFNPTVWIRRVLLTLLALTPIFSVMEVIALFQGTIESQAKALTPTAIKAIRDVGWALVIMLGLCSILIRRRVSSHFIVATVLSVLGAYAAFAMLPQSAYLAAAGVRWLMPVVMTFFLLGQVDEAFFHRAHRITRLLLILQLTVQFGQFFFASDWYGKNAFGFAARSPGFFLIPSTGAFFTMLCFFLAQFYSKSRAEKAVMTFLSMLSILLTASGTGYIVFMFALMLCVMGQKYIRVALPLMLIAAAFAFPFIMMLTGRGADYAEISFGSRVEIFIDAIETGTFLPSYFGVGTNTGVLMSNALDLPLQARIVDSTLTSVLINFGFFGFGLFLTGLLIWTACVLFLNKLELYVFTIIFVCFGVVVIVPECFPANLLFAALMAHYLHRYVRFANPAHEQDDASVQQGVPRLSAASQPS
jgi:hypothetical protein